MVEELYLEGMVPKHEVHLAIQPRADEDFIAGLGQGRIELENLDDLSAVGNGPVVGYGP